MTVCYSPCINCSYEEVAKTECDIVTHDANEADICMDDPVYFFARFYPNFPKCTLWGDTMSNPLYYREYLDAPPFDVASRWNYDYFKKAGFHVLNVKPRHILVDNSVTASDRTIPFIVVGVSRFFDRKNISLVQELGIRSKTVVVSRPNPGLGIRNGMLTKVPIVNPDVLAFTVDRKVINMNYARSRYYLALSVSEGFGLPPIEAMYYGVIPIYVNGHGFRENLVGIPIDIRDEYTVKVRDYYFRVWEPDIRELRDVINSILDSKMKEEEEDLREKVKERAKRFVKGFGLHRIS